LTPEVGALNTLLRREQAAVATYDSALAHFEDHAFYVDLRTIRYHHQLAAGALRDHITNLGGDPAADAGDWPPVDSDAPAGLTVADCDALLAALREGEERTVLAYEAALERDQMPDECRFAIRAELLPRCHEHIDTLSAMASALTDTG